jgi:23S rRNA-/tRNA-specific pseudouridylate synthase
MEHVVGPESAGERLDVFLAQHVGSRAAAQRLIDAGLVLVDGEARPKRHAVSAGERVSVGDAPQVAEPDVPDARFAIAYEDEHLLVVDKPAGWCTRRAATGGGRSRRRWRAGSRAAIPAARASCTGSTATPPGSWSWPAARRCTRR